MLSGTIPYEIYNISTLTHLFHFLAIVCRALPTNLCSGIPFLNLFYVGAITNLPTLYLTLLEFIERINLIDNNLITGSSSSELSFITALTNCRFLTCLLISGNPFVGTLPSSIGNLSSQLERFAAAYCGLMGRFPAEIGSLTNLIRIPLGSNYLSGNIPLTVKHLLNLQALFLDDNSLSGSISDDLCGLHSLSELDLSTNKLSGSIPQCLGNVTSLRRLSLNSNMFTSTIPIGIWRLKDLLTLDLSANSLIGFLPPEVDNLAAAIYINLSINQLAKSIPSTIGSLRNLVVLSLAHNRLEGSIPVSIGSMLGLENLDVSYNNLSGSLPNSLEALQYLNSFDVSFNDLSGEIPTGGPLVNFTMESFKGNEALCGIPRFHVPPYKVVSSHRSKRKRLERALFILAEYGFGGLVSTRCDVYRYGVMLMETFTRKKPTSILELAFKCSAEIPSDRIGMKEALIELEKIKRRFLD
ncbi:non-specific serine/threonine protein kinase [Salvia divinorum]|uniref:Non-specific serine/threonine protein kinase n=1 Tax=Salvia divinorum TaxID=28513 RepID=A0ABD1GYK3_SALDI